MLDYQDLTSHSRRLDQVQLNVSGQSKDFNRIVSQTNTSGLGNESQPEANEAPGESSHWKPHSLKVWKFKCHAKEKITDIQSKIQRAADDTLERPNNHKYV